jgi:hypothetical protein
MPAMSEGSLIDKTFGGWMRHGSIERKSRFGVSVGL